MWISVVVTRRKFCYSTFKVLTLCCLRCQSTSGVKTDIKQQTFRVANFPSDRMADKYWRFMLMICLLLDLAASRISILRSSSEPPVHGSPIKICGQVWEVVSKLISLSGNPEDTFLKLMQVTQPQNGSHLSVCVLKKVTFFWIYLNFTVKKLVNFTVIFFWRWTSHQSSIRQEHLRTPEAPFAISYSMVFYRSRNFFPGKHVKVQI